MSSRSLLRAFPAAVVVLLALAAAPAAATTIVPIADPLLVDQAPVILVGRAEGTLPATGTRPVTDWLITVEQVLKGEVTDGAIVVRVLGGENAQGEKLTVYGAPRFRPGERVLLFVAPNADGTWAIAQFLQGAFQGVQVGNRLAAVQDLTEVEVVGTRRRTRSAPALRDFDLFREWIADRVAGLSPVPDYRFRPSRRQMKAIVSGFTLLENDGLPMRWFEFDGGGSVTWKAYVGGQPGLPGGGFTEFERGLAAWTNEPTTPVRLVYGGTSSATAGFQRFDRQNVLLFGDPNQDIEGTFDCSQGGTIAVGGPWSNSSVTGRFNGHTFVRIQGADIVMNDGIECSFAHSPDPSKYMEEVYAHELGHTVGLGHSSENPNEPNALLREALMYYRAHDDRRGARFNSDDLAGLQTLYKKGTGGGGNGSCPAGTLCLLGGRFHVTVTWDNQYNGLSGVGGPIRNTDVSGFFYFDDAANIELIVKILDFGDVFKVFYGQLTNLHFTMTVVDTLSGTTKTYANTPGDCGAIDNNAFPHAPASRRGLRSHSGRSSAGGGTCTADANTLCLQGDRIKVTANWRNQYNGTSGVARARPLTQVSGGLYFLDGSNLELLVKAVDFGTYYLLMYGALSDLGYDLAVTDTITGTTRTYQNAAGHYCGGLDGNTFRK